MAAPPVAVVCVGMAGSGKTTFMQRINAHLHSKGTPPYVVNLDPAVRNVPFDSNIDIRDSVNYKKVMKEYRLGPNGGILTSLNLFSTKVDQIVGLLEKRCLPSRTSPAMSATSTPATKKPYTHILVDTPGQIEVFVWSASGEILLGSIASSFPTVLAYIIDTPRTASTSTFMSNMLYACSILYKTRLPMILVFNKTDVKDADFAKAWMSDFETFQAALRREEETGSFGGVEGGEGGPAGMGSGYMGSLLNSMSLVLEEFYRHLQVVSVSSMTGDGIDEFFIAVDQKAAEFERDYRPELDRRRKSREQEKEVRRDKELGKLMRDVELSAGTNRGLAVRRKEEPETVSDLEDEPDDSDTSEGLVEPEERDIEHEGSDEGDPGRRHTHATASEDLSFARYIHSTNVRRPS